MHCVKFCSVKCQYYVSIVILKLMYTHMHMHGHTHLPSQKTILVEDARTILMVRKQAKCVLHLIFLLTNMTLNAHPCTEC